MKTPSALSALIAGLLLVSCGASNAVPAPTAISTTLAATTLAVQPTTIITSVPTALVPVPTAKPTVRAVTFNAADNIALTGTLYGSGAIAVVLSNMGDNDPSAWDAFAPGLAARGYIVLTYKFRYPTNSPTFDSGMAHHTLDDLRAAIAFVRGQGAQKLVLVGASLGGMATAKVAAVENPAAMVILASPVDLAAYDFRVEESELKAITAPKLFIGSEGDTTVPFAETRRMFDLAPGPKELQSYPGPAHGVHIFQTKHGDGLRERLITFITASAPPA